MYEDARKKQRFENYTGICQGVNIHTGVLGGNLQNKLDLKRKLMIHFADTQNEDICLKCAPSALSGYVRDSITKKWIEDPDYYKKLWYEKSCVELNQNTMYVVPVAQSPTGSTIHYSSCTKDNVKTAHSGGEKNSTEGGGDYWNDWKDTKKKYNNNKRSYDNNNAWSHKSHQNYISSNNYGLEKTPYGSPVLLGDEGESPGSGKNSKNSSGWSYDNDWSQKSKSNSKSSSLKSGDGQWWNWNKNTNSVDNTDNSNNNTNSTASSKSSSKKKSAKPTKIFGGGQKKLLETHDCVSFFWQNAKGTEGGTWPPVDLLKVFVQILKDAVSDPESPYDEIIFAGFSRGAFMLVNLLMICSGVNNEFPFVDTKTANEVDAKYYYNNGTEWDTVTDEEKDEYIGLLREIYNVFGSLKKPGAAGESGIENHKSHNIKKVDVMLFSPWFDPKGMLGPKFLQGLHRDGYYNRVEKAAVEVENKYSNYKNNWSSKNDWSTNGNSWKNNNSKNKRNDWRSNDWSSNGWNDWNTKGSTGSSSDNTVAKTSAAVVSNNSNNSTRTSELTHEILLLKSLSSFDVGFLKNICIVYSSEDPYGSINFSKKMKELLIDQHQGINKQEYALTEYVGVLEKFSNNNDFSNTAAAAAAAAAVSTVALPTASDDDESVMSVVENGDCSMEGVSLNNGSKKSTKKRLSKKQKMMYDDLGLPTTHKNEKNSTAAVTKSDQSILTLNESGLVDTALDTTPAEKKAEGTSTTTSISQTKAITVDTDQDRKPETPLQRQIRIVRLEHTVHGFDWRVFQQNERVASLLLGCGGGEGDECNDDNLISDLVHQGLEKQLGKNKKIWDWMYNLVRK